MNNPNPLLPQGSLQQQAKKKVSVPVAVFSILAAHVVVVLGLLLSQGCNPKTKNNTAGTDNSASNNVASLTAGTDTLSNSPAVFPPLGGTNTLGNFATAPTTSSVVAAPATSNPIAAPYADNLTRPGGTTSGLTSGSSAPPLDKPLTVEPAASEGHEYTVAKGDTLAKIAKKNGVKVSALKKANPNVVPEKLKVGQKLTIPGGGKATMEASSTGTGVTGNSSGAAGSATTADAGEGSSYKVKPGDTLTKIAKSHGTTAKKLRAFNALTTDKIKVGQTLKIPAGGGSAERVASRTGATTETPLPTATETLPSSGVTPISAPASSNVLAPR